MWPVGVKLPNGMGLFDMHGNACEWCHNLYASPAGRADVEAKNAENRCYRGGTFTNQPELTSSGNRNGNNVLSLRSVGVGFCPARTYYLPPVTGGHATGQWGCRHGFRHATCVRSPEGTDAAAGHSPSGFK